MNTIEIKWQPESTAPVSEDGEEEIVFTALYKSWLYSCCKNPDGSYAKLVFRKDVGLDAWEWVPWKPEGWFPIPPTET